MDVYCPTDTQTKVSTMEDQASNVEEYIKVLDEKGNDAATQWVYDVFGKETDEDFKAEEYQAFANEVVATLIQRNLAMIEDEETANTVEEKDEADA